MEKLFEEETVKEVKAKFQATKADYGRLEHKWTLQKGNLVLTVSCKVGEQALEITVRSSPE